MSGAFRSFLIFATLFAGAVFGGPLGVQGFAFSGVSNRFITPNGDGRNDNVAFRFSNPSDAAGTVKIYDLRGHIVTTISISSGGSLSCPVNAPGNPGCPVWDGRADGAVVSSGVYIYVISVDGVTASGALVVIR